MTQGQPGLTALCLGRQEISTGCTDFGRFQLSPSRGQRSTEPLLRKIDNCAELGILVQQGGAHLLRRRSDPGIGHRERLTRLEACRLFQKRLLGLHPAQRQGLELLIGQAAGALALVFPDAVEHLHPA